ncbi:MAG: redoxin family protein [Acidimicrobiia bacterium]|nr:redoxin family protein [Acidimicrobiia bacterium]
MAQKSKPTASSQSSRAPVLVAIIVALIAAAAIIAVVSSRGGDDEGGGTDTAGSIVTGTVTVEGSALSPTEDFADDPAVGQAFPVLGGQALLDGAPMEIAADGNPKLVIFLAHWCPHCQEEVPKITEWLDANGMPEGVDLYAVSTGVAEERDNFPPASWLRSERWQVPTMADSPDGTAAAAAGLSAYPFFVAVDADGDVVARASGELSVEQLEALVGLARGA